jgi:4-amino-4-deoxy-L-arabinose transferase-like glycosyltransferase
MWFKNPFKSKRKALFLFPLAFACIALFPMFGKGMFMDGILYAIISQNVAHDVCGIWSLKITDSLYPHFNEHPPLVFALQSLFFKFLGNHYWVERIYSLTTVLVSAYLIVKIYQSIARVKGSASTDGVSWVEGSSSTDGGVHTAGIARADVNAPTDGVSWVVGSTQVRVSTPTNGSAPMRGSAQKKGGKYPSAAWVLLLWISVPVVNRCAQNNMLENTMLVFVLASVWAYFKSQSISTNPPNPLKYPSLNSFFWLFISGLMLFLAFMSKGFTGLFPFSLPLIFAWIYKGYRIASSDSNSHKETDQLTFRSRIPNVNPSQRPNPSFLSKNTIFEITTQTLQMMLGFAVSFILMIWIFPESLDALQRYFQKQVVGSLEQVQTVSTRFKILGDYILALLPMLLVSLLLGWYLNRSKIDVARVKLQPQKSIFMKIKYFMRRLKSQNQKSPLVNGLLLLSLTGVLPIMISLKQSDYYIYCVFPFTAMAVIIGFKDNWFAFENQLFGSNKWQTALIIICFIFGGWGFAQSGKVQRDKELWNDINSMVSSLKQKEGDSSLVLGSFRALKDDWYMQAYLYRYFNITVQNYRVPNDEKNFEYYLVPKNYIRDSLNGITPLNLQLNKYELWQKKR